MIWIIGVPFVLGIVLMCITTFLTNSSNPDNRLAARPYALSSFVLIGLSMVLLLGNAIIQALL